MSGWVIKLNFKDFLLNLSLLLPASGQLLYVAQPDGSLGRIEGDLKDFAHSYFLDGSGTEGSHELVTVAFVLSLTMTSTLL